jgi:6-pyruvoyltetrahydropterin/6-carboxytetrahydropterin synthase
MKVDTATIILRRSFEAAHLLPNVPAGHKCGRTHGHSYLVEFAVAGEVDPIKGWVMDFGDIRALSDPLIGQLDHKLLNDIEGLSNPTSENLCLWLLAHLRKILPGLSWVEVSETEKSRCRIAVAE